MKSILLPVEPEEKSHIRFVDAKEKKFQRKFSESRESHKSVKHLLGSV